MEASGWLTPPPSGETKVRERRPSPGGKDEKVRLSAARNEGVMRSRQAREEIMGHSSDAWTETEKGIFRQWLKASYDEVAGQHNKDAEQRCEIQPLLQDLDKVLPLTQNSPAQTHCGPVSSVTEGVPVPWPGLDSPFAGEASYQDALVSQLETVSMVAKDGNGRGPGDVANSSRTPVIQTPSPKTCFSLAADHTNYMGSLASEHIRDGTGCTQHDGYSPAVDRVGCAPNNTPHSGQVSPHDPAALLATALTQALAAAMTGASPASMAAAQRKRNQVKAGRYDGTGG